MKLLAPADKKKNKIANLVLFVALLVSLFALDATASPVDMLVKVLQKGCVYAVVAVSMNLLNGFTGLFSLGQAGLYADRRIHVCDLFGGRCQPGDGVQLLRQADR